MNKMLPPALSRPIAVAVGLLACGVNLNVVAHGYVSEPEGRSYLCKLGDNIGCGAVQWEPQSVEGPDGNPRFPIEGPEDGTIAAAGSPTWSELNAQTPSRWYKHDFAAGYQTFEWTFTANHASRDWRYFMTKPGWNASQPLSREAFDLNPFCEYDGGMVRPPMVVQHSCDVPEREGYHVILAVWDVGDTAASFYNAIDVNFAGNDVVIPLEPETDVLEEVGLISGAIALEAGDTLSTLAYDEDGEIPSMSVSYQAEGYTSGSAAALSLARAINDASVGYYAGQRDGEVFVPVAGQNRIYSDSGITNVEVRVDYAPEPEFVYTATLDADDRVEINAMGMTDVNFTIAVNANSLVTATLFDELGDTVIGDEWSLSGEADLKLHVHEAVAGTLTLVVIADSLDTSGTKQITTVVQVEDNRVIPNPDDNDHSDTDHDHTEPGTCDVTDPMAGMFAAYSDATTYTGGETVAYQGLVYEAKWWTRGKTPDTTDAFELISEVTLGYSDNTIYEGGDQARYQGKLYEAKWWTRGTAPSSTAPNNNGPWALIGDADC